MNENKIVKFIQKKFKPFQYAIIGLSGGIDSTLVAYLAVKALGKEKVKGILLPHNNQSYEDAENVANLLGIVKMVVNIGPVINSFPPAMYGTKLSEGNLKARIRMCYLYLMANQLNGLVLGTTNRSEYEIGYFTKWGDGACDIEPIMHLWKREVKEMATKLGVPKDLVERVPSAELWPGQTDESEFGFTYDDLEEYFTAEYPCLSKAAKKNIQLRIKNNQHKREGIPNLLK